MTMSLFLWRQSSCLHLMQYYVWWFAYVKSTCLTNQCSCWKVGLKCTDLQLFWRIWESSWMETKNPCGWTLTWGIHSLEEREREWRIWEHRGWSWRGLSLTVMMKTILMKTMLIIFSDEWRRWWTTIKRLKQLQILLENFTVFCIDTQLWKRLACFYSHSGPLDLSKCRVLFGSL